MDKLSKIILISGPTASGKSNFAVKLAKKVKGEIINADSMQVYKQLTILTARPSKKDQRNIKHHLYGMIDVSKSFSTGQWLKLTVKKIKEIRKKKKIPILVGGTGLYFQSLVNGLAKIPNIPIKIRSKVRLMQKKNGQNEFYKKLLKLDNSIQNKFNPNDAQRSIRAYEIMLHTRTSMYDWLKKTKPIFKENNFLKLYVNFSREKLIKRISLRTAKMLQNGAIKEVKRFSKKKLKNENSVNKVIGLNELKQYLDNQMTLDRVREIMAIRTRQYAKRQATWARSKMISWTKINPSEISSYIKKINKSSLKLDQLI